MNKKQIVVITIILVVLAAGIVMAFNSSKPDLTPTKEATVARNASDLQVENKNMAPSFSLSTIDGKTISLADYKDKGIILNFWATWCPPCRAEIPDMIELQSEYESKNFTFIGVAVGDKPEKVKTYIKNQGINYPVAIGTPEITNDYGQFIDGGIRGIPTSFIINTKGEVLGHFVGARSKEVFEEAIKESLKK